MTDQPINNDALAKTTVTFVIGATASGKTTFIQNCFSNNRNTVILNVYDYQQAAYKEAGFGKHIPLGQEFKCFSWNNHRRSNRAQNGRFQRMCVI